MSIELYEHSIMPFEQISQAIANGENQIFVTATGRINMSDFEILDRNAKVDPCYGLEEFRITKEEIAALLSGKKLYSTINDDEYAITIRMAKIDVEEVEKCF